MGALMMIFNRELKMRRWTSKKCLAVDYEQHKGILNSIRRITDITRKIIENNKRINDRNLGNIHIRRH
jgi:hypothetical protein